MTHYKWSIPAVGAALATLLTTACGMNADQSGRSTHGSGIAGDANGSNTGDANTVGNGNDTGDANHLTLSPRGRARGDATLQQIPVSLRYAFFQPTQKGNSTWLVLSSDPNQCDHRALEAARADSSLVNIFVASGATLGARTNTHNVFDDNSFASIVTALDPTCKERFVAPGPHPVVVGDANLTQPTTFLDEETVHNGNLIITTSDPNTFAGTFDLWVGDSPSVELHGDFNAIPCPAMQKDADAANVTAPYIPRVLDASMSDQPTTKVCLP